jgi:hypothetical protein
MFLPIYSAANNRGFAAALTALSDVNYFGRLASINLAAFFIRFPDYPHYSATLFLPISYIYVSA